MIFNRLIALASILVLAGCTQLPTSGEVESIDPSSVLTTSEVDFLPPGPSAGASPEEILQGFVAAGTAAQNNYRVARSYLSEVYRDEWNPNQSVLIVAGEPIIDEQADGQWVYSVPVVSSVDEAGRYGSVSRASNQELLFRLSQVDGEWRITEAPDGIVLGELAFREAFESVRLYYFSADYRELVPDVRWFASRGDVLTKVIRGLLEPPTYWLDQGATVSAFPSGTQLVLSPVPVVEGQAQVDLTDGVLQASDVQQARMLWQLNTTLTQISDVSDVAITVNQTPLPVPEIDEEQPALTTGRDPRPVVIRGRDFGYLQAGRIEAIDELEAGVASLRPEMVFYSSEYGQAAVVGEGGLWRVTADGPGEIPLDSRENLVRPAIDSCGLVWSVSEQPGADAMRVFPPTVVNPDEDVWELALELPEDSRLISFELARDNTRMLLLVQAGESVRVLLTAIERSSDCEPEGIGEFLELTPLDGQGVDAAFVDDGQVAIVARDGAVGEAVIQDVSGRAFSAGRPSAPTTLVGGVGGVPGLRLLNATGQILQPRGNGWQDTGERANVLVTQR
jgi:hypothetical protein